MPIRWVVKVGTNNNLKSSIGLVFTFSLKLAVACTLWLHWHHSWIPCKKLPPRHITTPLVSHPLEASFTAENFYSMYFAMQQSKQSVHWAVKQMLCWVVPWNKSVDWNIQFLLITRPLVTYCSQLLGHICTSHNTTKFWLA